MIFQDFPGPGIFKKKNPGLSRRRGNPVLQSKLAVEFTLMFRSRQQQQNVISSQETSNWVCGR